MALRNYRVKRARFYPDGGVEEIEFESTATDEAPHEAELAAEPTVVALPFTPGKSQPVISGDVMKRPGYAELFGAQPPRFKPNEG